MHILNGLLGVGTAFIWGIILFNLDLSNTDPIALILTILVTTFSTSGLGLLMGCLGLITREVMFINNFIYFFILVFSGANIAISELPVWMQGVSRYIPLTRGIASARMIINGSKINDVMPILLEEIALGVFFTFLGYFLFRWFENTAKKKGTLEVF
jgi:ABC-2 type transport system permease protein